MAIVWETIDSFSWSRSLFGLMELLHCSPFLIILYLPFTKWTIKTLRKSWEIPLIEHSKHRFSLSSLPKVDHVFPCSLHISGQLTCQRAKWNWRPLVFLFDYSWGYFPMASLLALVKRFVKSAFRVDLRSISADDNNPHSRNTAFLLMATK